MQLERLTVECNQRRKVLDNEFAETLSVQVGLVRIFFFLIVKMMFTKALKFTEILFGLHFTVRIG